LEPQPQVGVIVRLKIRLKQSRFQEKR